MLRWLTGLAFALFLAAVIGLVNVAFAAIEEPLTQQAAARLQTTAYPTATVTATNPASYPLQAATASATVAPSSTLLATPTVGVGGGATATPGTATPSFTRTITPSPTITLVPSATPLRTSTVIAIVTSTVTPIRVIGLPVPGPTDKLPSTGGSMMDLLNVLLFSGGAGGVLFALGRVLKRRQS